MPPSAGSRSIGRFTIHLWAARNSSGAGAISRMGCRAGQGYYVSGDYQFARRWFAGARYDWSNRCGRCVAARQRTVGGPDLLAERIQPDPWSIPADSIRCGTDCKRVPDAIPIFNRCAWRAPVLVMSTRKVFMNIRFCLVALIACFLATSPLRAQSKLNVIATTEDLASIAREVGGDHITVDSIAKGLSGSALR